MSARSEVEVPSVPSATLTPALLRSRIRAMPEPSLRFESGLWLIEQPRVAEPLDLRVGQPDRVVER